MTHRLCLGIITGAKGLKGEVRLKPFTSETGHLVSLGPLESEDGTQSFRLFALKDVQGGVTAHIKGVEDRNAAEALKGVKLFIARVKLPKLAPDEFYHADLLGLRAVDETGAAVGTVKAVHDFGAGDILEIEPETAPSFMVPFTQDVIPDIDFASGCVTVRMPVEIDVGPEEKEEKTGRAMSDLAPSAEAVHTPWTASVLTLFPDAFPGTLNVSLIGKALEGNIFNLDVVNIRNFATDKHHTVDGATAGGGAGMVLRADILAAAIDAVLASDVKAGRTRPLIYLSPRGTPITQTRIRALAATQGVIFLCGRFEGVDERLLESRAIEEVSLGDIVLAGGEVAAQALIEAVIRLLPGVMGDAGSASEESFEDDLLEYPHYTKPTLWEGREIPPILLSGDHGKIAAFRRNAAETLTKLRRPDLFARYLGRKEGKKGS